LSNVDFGFGLRFLFDLGAGFGEGVGKKEDDERRM